MGVHLMGLHLMGVHLTGMHLMETHFMGMHLIGVHLIGVYLTGVHLMGVCLITLFRGCTATGDIAGSCLQECGRCGSAALPASVIKVFIRFPRDLSMVVTELTDIAGVHRANPAPPVF